MTSNTTDIMKLGSIGQLLLNGVFVAMVSAQNQFSQSFSKCVVLGVPSDHGFRILGDV